jgi:ParB-like chromosome segregation protein Spo0J
MNSFQPMPDLPEEQYAALRAEIEANGIIVPIVVDQHGCILDGHNRKRIADELGIEVPTEVRHVADDEEATDLAVALNCARRHLTRDQVRQVIAGEIKRRPDDSDRAIARRVGCSPSTVGAVRKSEVSNLDTSGLNREEAEQRTDAIRDHLQAVREHVAALIYMGLSSGVPRAEIVMALTRAQRDHAERAGHEVADVFRTAVFEPLIDVAMSGPDVPAAVPADEEAHAALHEARTTLIEGLASFARPRAEES